jgi:hypothetical protein
VIETFASVPLQFWFCRNPGLALPLIALQYHEVGVAVKFRSLADVCASGAANTDLSATLWADYIYLDTDERRRMAQVSHEYLIEQLQFTGDESYTTNTRTVDLNFNHPVKELVWTARGGNATISDYAVTPAGTAGGDNLNTRVLNPVVSGLLKLNGHERFATQQGPYFNVVQPRCHTNTPSQGVNVYSFALKPEDHQPSGTCNFSRIDNAQLVLRLRGDDGAVNSAITNGLVKVYAVNYNVLRIMSGMGGLAYSN